MSTLDTDGDAKGAMVIVIKGIITRPSSYHPASGAKDATMIVINITMVMVIIIIITIIFISFFSKHLNWNTGASDGNTKSGDG